MNWILITLTVRIIDLCDPCIPPYEWSSLLSFEEWIVDVLYLCNYCPRLLHSNWDMRRVKNAEWFVIQNQFCFIKDCYAPWNFGLNVWFPADFIIYNITYSVRKHLCLSVLYTERIATLLPIPSVNWLTKIISSMQ